MTRQKPKQSQLNPSKKMKWYYNEKDLVEALEKQSNANPKLYFYPFSEWGRAMIFKMQKLNSQAPTDCMKLSFGRAYYKNGKRKQFTKKQIIKDQQIGWS